MNATTEKIEKKTYKIKGSMEKLSLAVISMLKVMENS